MGWRWLFATAIMRYWRRGRTPGKRVLRMRLTGNLHVADRNRLTASLTVALLCLAGGAAAQPPLIDPVPRGWHGAPIPLPKLRAAPGGHAPPIVTSALATNRLALSPASLVDETGTPAAALASLRAAMVGEVVGLLAPDHAWQRDAVAHAQAMLVQTGHRIDTPQLILLVDRDPARQRLAVMLAQPAPTAWQMVGSVHVSTGQANRKDYYITPVGVFPHTDAILDFRAEGTYNEHHVRGLGTAGMRVWDFGWHWAVKGWHTDGEGGDIRLMMHATDPDLLERRLGRPASEGCVRVSSSLNRFLDRHGVLDADYERAASQDIRFSALLGHDHEPSPLAGRLLVVIDTSLPADALPTAAGRPAGWPSPEPASVAGVKPEGHG
jgi:hypothetical protein